MGKLLRLVVHFIVSTLDFGYNISERIRSLMRNPDIKTIVNGKQIKYRDVALKGIARTCRMSLNRDKTKSLTIKQAIAIKNKYDANIKP